MVPSLYVGAGDKIRYSGVHGHVLVENSCKPSFMWVLGIRSCTQVHMDMSGWKRAV